MCLKIGEKFTYANVFEVKVENKFVSARISTSRKKDEEYVNSGWSAVFIGDCLKDAKSLEDRDRIKITNAYVSNETYLNKDGEKRTFTKVTIFNFEIASDTKKEKYKEKTKKSSTNNRAVDDDEDDVPL